VSGDDAALLRLEGLRVAFGAGRHWTEVVAGVSLEIAPGEALGLAGESGCGKSTVAYALLGEARPGSRITAGRVLFEGADLLALPERALRRLRGARIGFVPQNPTVSLTPSMTCGSQLAELLAYHGRARGRAARAEAAALFARVGLPEPEAMLGRYPHQLSGGQQQRVVIAMALACRPSLIVLDEPTTGLDVTTQQRILQLLAELRRRDRLALLHVSHDLGALAQLCDRIAVMYAGRLVEVGPTAALLARPRHPYSRGLIAAVPRLDRPPDPGLALRGLLRRAALPEGCPFAPRCDWAEPACRGEVQRLLPERGAHRVACRRVDAVALQRPAAAREAALG
jgi:peptide/nickel transport system ATP-binding protein